MKNMKLRILIIMILLYILMSVLVVCNAATAGTLSRDINSIDNNKYPGFKTQINNLKSKHSNYTFLVYYTGLDWNEVLTSEYQYHGVSPLNLFQVGTKYNGMWQCPICGNRNYDNGSWCCASLEAISYMMDPRNSINESDIFQFKDLEGADASYDDIARAVSGYGAYLNNSEAIQAIYDASKQYNINPYFLVAKIINEHGKNGSTLSNGKGYNGNYVGYYNYFNIGSYGNGAATIINSGLSRAQKEGWNSIRASILGGTAVVKESYITRYSQNTLYYQKFNVSGRSALGSHQYQQNIMAAQTQGASLKNYYGSNNSEFVFIIPLYENMPKTFSARPDCTKQNVIQYEDGTIKNIRTSLTLRAAPSGTAIGALNNSESIKIIKRADTQVNGYYWDTILSNKSGLYGYAARVIGGDECISGTGSWHTSGGTTSDYKPEETVTPVVEPDEKPEENNSTDTNTTELPQVEKPVITEENINDYIKEDESFLDIHPEVKIENIAKKYENAVIKNSKGEEVKEGKLGTGFKVILDDKEYIIVKKGDLDGDTNVTIIDAVVMLNAIKGNRELIDEYKEAALISNTEKYTIIDAVKILNYIKGTGGLEIK